VLALYLRPLPPHRTPMPGEPTEAAAPAPGA
jgi:hypothetical protein